MSKNAHKTVYFVPGMATDYKIFERIRLSKENYNWQVIEWLPPKRNESLHHYVIRMAKEIKDKEPILVGVSFGGVVVQEMKRMVNPEKTIIISSVKSRKEFPRYMRFSAATKLYKLLTASKLLSVSDLSELGWNSKIKRRLRKMQYYLNVRDAEYLNWAIQNMIEWERQEEDPEIYHIHGTKDEVFPIQYIKRCRKIEGGTHAMILDKTPTVTKELINIIEQE